MELMDRLFSVSYLLSQIYLKSIVDIKGSQLKSKTFLDSNINSLLNLNLNSRVTVHDMNDLVKINVGSRIYTLSSFSYTFARVLK